MTLGPDARDLIDAARGGDDPSVDDAARIRAKLAARLSAAAAVTTVTAASTSAAAKLAAAGNLVVAASSMGTVAKVLILAAVVTGTVGTSAVVLRPSSSAPAPVALVQPRSTASAALPDAGTIMPGPSRAEATSVPSEEPEPEPLPAVPASVAAGRALLSPAARDTGAPPPVLFPVSPTARVNEALPAGPREGQRQVREAPAPLDAVVAEAALLQLARAALASGDGAGALAHLDEHAQRFPRGVLGEERQAARVLALCVAGRAGESRAAAAVFLASTPQSPLATQVSRACTSR